MLGSEHAHEPEPSSTVEIAWIEQDRGHGDPSLQLLQQRESAIDGEQGPRSHDEDDVAKRIASGRLPSPAEAEAFLRGLLTGVAHMHDKKTVHRDIDKIAS